MRYETPAALRAAIQARLAQQARDSGTRADRLWRRLAFERLLARLAVDEPGRWVLKGGMALEMRWLERARTTKDLDLALAADADDPDTVHELLVRALSRDPDGDGFRFEVRAPAAISADLAGRPGWRVGVTAILAGRPCAQFSLDIVARTEELARTEAIRLPGTLSFAGIRAREVEAVDLAQHFAEKLHAMTRTYGDGNPSSRARDLVDIVLVLEEQPLDVGAVREAVKTVFRARGTHAIPNEIADPPTDWERRYADYASELDLEASTLAAALELVREYWKRTTEDWEV